MTSPRGGGPAASAAPRVFSLGFLVLSLVCSAPGDAHALERPVFRLYEGVRFNLRETKEDVPNEVVSRAEADFFAGKKWTLFPFFEARADVDDDTWSRIEAGAELGLRPFSWVYLGNGIHRAWVNPHSDRMEWEVRSVLTVPLGWKVRSERVSLYALNEWTFDLEIGEGSRNELGAGFRIPLPWKPFSASLGWRHVDLIHRSDMDQFEGTLRAEF